MAVAVGFEPTEGEPSRAFEVCDGQFSTDHPGYSGRSTRRTGPQRSPASVGECHQNCAVGALKFWDRSPAGQPRGTTDLERTLATSRSGPSQGGKLRASPASHDPSGCEGHTNAVATRAERHQRSRTRPRAIAVKDHLLGDSSLYHQCGRPRDRRRTRGTLSHKRIRLPAHVQPRRTPTKPSGRPHLPMSARQPVACSSPICLAWNLMCQMRTSVRRRHHSR
jgi:hypothetical protein